MTHTIWNILYCWYPNGCRYFEGKVKILDVQVHLTGSLAIPEVARRRDKDARCFDTTLVNMDGIYNHTVD